MKSKIEIRKFAVEIAAEIMGKGTSDKDVVVKAKEIETYVIGEAILPDVYDESNAITSAIGGILANLPLEESTKSKK